MTAAATTTVNLDGGLLVFSLCCLSAALISFAAFVTVWRAQRRCYDYATNRAEAEPFNSPKNQAYSDMATVIALDGKVRDDRG